MFFHLQFLLLTLLTFTVVHTQEEVLDSSNFDAQIKAYQLVLVDFFADWCHFCRQLAPIWTEAAGKLTVEKMEHKILLAKIDCVAETGLAAKYGVNKYPTMKLFREGVLQSQEYRGARTVDAIVEYVKKQLEPVYKVINKSTDKLTDVKTGNDEVHVLGVFTSMDANNAEFSAFKKISFALGGACSFYAISGFASNVEGVYVRNHDNWESSSSVPLTLHTLPIDNAIRKVSDLCKPFIREITFQNAEEITEEGKPLLILFYPNNDKESKVKFSQLILKDFKDETSVYFVTADGSTFTHPLSHLGVDHSQLPVLVIDSFQHMYKFKKSLTDAINNPALLREFIDDLHSGKLHVQFHFGELETESSTKMPAAGSSKTPPESIFKSLQPSKDRYSMHDEF